MSSDRSTLHDLSLLSNQVLVNLSNGTQVKVAHQGKFRIASGLILEHVLLFPNFKFNFLSIKRLCEQFHCDVKFTKELCMIHASFLRKPLLIGRAFSGFYILDKWKIGSLKIQDTKEHLISTCIEARKCSDFAIDTYNTVASLVQSDVWHRRLGHMSHDKMKMISEHAKFSNKGHFICKICPKAK